MTLNVTIVVLNVLVKQGSSHRLVSEKTWPICMWRKSNVAQHVLNHNHSKNDHF